MNNFILVGKYLDNPTPKIIRLQVERLLENGEKEYYILPIKLLEPTHTPQLIAERLSFLSSKQQEETQKIMGEGEI